MSACAATYSTIDRDPSVCGAWDRSSSFTNTICSARKPAIRSSSSTSFSRIGATGRELNMRTTYRPGMTETASSQMTGDR